MHWLFVTPPHQGKHVASASSCSYVSLITAEETEIICFSSVSSSPSYMIHIWCETKYEFMTKSAPQNQIYQKRVYIYCECLIWIIQSVLNAKYNIYIYLSWSNTIFIYFFTSTLGGYTNLVWHEESILTGTRHLLNVLQSDSLQEFRIVVLDKESHEILARVQVQRQRLSDLRSGRLDDLPQCLRQLQRTLIRCL